MCLPSIVWPSCPGTTKTPSLKSPEMPKGECLSHLGIDDSTVAFTWFGIENLKEFLSGRYR
jgi:hypothetical protein